VRLVLETLATAAFVLLAISAGAGFVLATLRLRGENLPAPDPLASLTAALGVIKQAREIDPPTGNAEEFRQLMRAERAANRADLAEYVEQVEGVAETVQRHRKKAQQVAKRAEESESEQQELPGVDDLEARRAQLYGLAKSQGKL